MVEVVSLDPAAALRDDRHIMSSERMLTAGWTC